MLIISMLQVPVIEPNATTSLLEVVRSTTLPAVSSAGLLDDTTVEPTMQSNCSENAGTPVDGQKQYSSDYQIPISSLEASVTLIESPDMPQQDEDGENDTSAVSSIVKGPLITRVLIEENQNVPEASVEDDDEVRIFRTLRSISDIQILSRAPHLMEIRHRQQL